MSNEAFAASAEMARQQAFVEANRSTVCVRCKKTKGVLNKRGHCFACNELRLATMKLDPVKEEEARRQADTIYSLLTGPSGRPQVSGADLNHATAAVSARANLSATFKLMGKYESHLIAYPNSVSAWESYERMYDRIEEYVKQIKASEAALKVNWPNLVVGQIRIPVKLERAADKSWLTV